MRDQPVTNSSRSKWLTKPASAIIAAALVAAVFYFAFRQVAYRWNWRGVYDYRSYFFKGWWITVRISLASLVLSTGIGIVFALVRRSPLLPIRYFGQIYVEVIR